MSERMVRFRSTAFSSTTKQGAGDAAEVESAEGSGVTGLGGHHVGHVRRLRIVEGPGFQPPGPPEVIFSQMKLADLELDRAVEFVDLPRQAVIRSACP